MTDNIEVFLNVIVNVRMAVTICHCLLLETIHNAIMNLVTISECNVRQHICQAISYLSLARNLEPRRFTITMVESEPNARLPIEYM